MQTFSTSLKFDTNSFVQKSSQINDKLFLLLGLIWLLTVVVAGHWISICCVLWYEELDKLVKMLKKQGMLCVVKYLPKPFFCNDSKICDWENLNNFASIHENQLVLSINNSFSNWMYRIFTKINKHFTRWLDGSTNIRVNRVYLWEASLGVQRSKSN